MNKRILLDQSQLNVITDRLCQQLLEHHNDFSNAAILGLQPRGIFLSDRIYRKLSGIFLPELFPPHPSDAAKRKSGKSPGEIALSYGHLDATFHRDDFRHQEKPLIASKTKLDFMIENKNVILIDDVLFTGRSVRAALDAMLAFGRPRSVELLVLIDRRFRRDLPIEAHYVGCTVDTIVGQKVKVEWKEEHGTDQVWLIEDKK